MPMHTSTSAIPFSQLNIVSPRNIDDKIAPDTGIKN
jgi:hypothetical protein